MGESKRLLLQHILNPLHVYCRLRDGGLSLKKARRIGMSYERAMKWMKSLPVRLKRS